MILVIVLVLLVVGSVLFHFLSPWWFTPIASNWGAIDDTIIITFWVTGTVFVLVNLFVALAVYRFRYNKNRKAVYEPENKKLEIWLTAVTSLGIAAMLAPGLFVWANFVNVPEDAAQVEVVGKQWHWNFRFPGKDGKLGSVDTRLITESNPFGINPRDTFGEDDILITSNELHLPENQPVRFLLRSVDVLHDFAVPQFRVKMDLVPGMVSYLWLTPTRTGSFEILCQELCGIAHHTMRGRVVVEEEQSFQEWLTSHPTFRQTQNAVLANKVAGQALYAPCSACHGRQGEGNAATNAPKLSGLPAWYLERQLIYYQQGVRGAHRDDVFGQQMAAMANILTDATSVKNVAAYIESLPDEDLSVAQADATTTSGITTVSGNVTRGQSYYQNCSACHGHLGEGNFFMNAPTLAGQQDWYLKRQLQNFSNGVRGSHPQDSYGRQMNLMAKTLKTEQAINDLIAYINTL